MIEYPGTPQNPFSALRSQIPLLQDVAYFQTGSLAPLAEPVREATAAMVEAEGNSALAGPREYASLHQKSEDQRARLASFLGAQHEEIGWTNSTTVAIRHAIDCLVWHAGDSLITTNIEHISTRALQAGLQQRHKVSTRVVDGSDGDDFFLSSLERELVTNGPGKLLMLSHVSCQDGRILPIAEAVGIAHMHDTPVLIDGAQAIGQIPVDVTAVGCDMLVGSSHKWLLGPAGLGFLYVSNTGLVTFDSPFGMAPRERSENGGPTNRRPVSLDLELGTASLAPRAGLAAAVEMIDTLGVEQISTRVTRLTKWLRNGLSEISSVSILTPETDGRSTGILSLTVPDGNFAQLSQIVDELWSSGRVVAKVQVEQPSIRVSVAAFNNEDDIDRFVLGLTTALTRRNA